MKITLLKLILILLTLHSNYSCSQPSNSVDYKSQGISYADWYLSSIYKLSLIYSNKELISSVCEANGGDWLEEGEFWISNQYSDTEA